jgi:hypothetical protein
MLVTVPLGQVVLLHTAVERFTLVRFAPVRFALERFA